MHSCPAAAVACWEAAHCVCACLVGELGCTRASGSALAANWLAGTGMRVEALANSPSIQPPGGAPASPAGALTLAASEALLPVQGCVALLGPRLKAAAMEGILQLCTQAMQRG